MPGKFHKDNTIQSKSSLYFLTSSQWAREHLIYIQSYGHFLCDERYSVRNREPFESLLCIVTLAGSGVIKTNLGTSFVKTGDIALIDCRAFHEYYAPESWEFDFVHFSGGNSYDIAGLFLEVSGNVLRSSGSVYSTKTIQKIAESKQLTLNRVQEIEHSRYLTDFMSELYSLAMNQQAPRSNQLEVALNYIRQHYCEKISMKELADLAQISVSSFEHTFQKAMDYSPYQYILNMRLDRAKYLLISTRMDVTEICYGLGFNSPAHFIRLFRTKNGVTPGEFRKKLLYSSLRSDEDNAKDEAKSEAKSEVKSEAFFAEGSTVSEKA